MAPLCGNGIKKSVAAIVANMIHDDIIRLDGVSLCGGAAKRMVVDLCMLSDIVRLGGAPLCGGRCKTNCDGIAHVAYYRGRLWESGLRLA